MCPEHFRGDRQICCTLAEVHPSLLAPEWVQNLFPDFKKATLIESKIPLLTDELKRIDSLL
jgi:hypothetical protein